MSFQTELQSFQESVWHITSAGRVLLSGHQDAYTGRGRICTQMFNLALVCVLEPAQFFHPTMSRLVKCDLRGKECSGIALPDLSSDFVSYVNYMGKNWHRISEECGKLSYMQLV